MKNLSLATIMWLFAAPVFSQSADWLWAKSTSGDGYQEGFAVATDKIDNIYITGLFGGDSITLGTITLHNRGSNNFLIAKYSPSGNVLWAKTASDSANAIVQGNSIATDDSGNVYVTGYFSGDSLTFGTTVLPYSDGFRDNFFIAKYDSSGNALWAKSVGGSGHSWGMGVATGGNGFVYVTGYFTNQSMNFGSVTLLNPGPADADDIFTAEYDASGNVLWAKGPGGINGSGNNAGQGIATDRVGNIYITGLFARDTLTFGSFTLYAKGEDDFFIAKYDSSGNVLWAKSAGGANGDLGYGVATDGSGNAYVTGGFDSDSITFGAYTLYNGKGVAYRNAFIVKYDSSGNVMWAQGSTGAGDDFGYSIAADESGNIYVTGELASDSIKFGATTLLQPPGSYDPMFLVKLSTNGTVLCTAALTSGGDDQNAVCVDHLGNACVAGDFYMVNPFIVGLDTLPLVRGVENIFVAKFSFSCGAKTEVEDIPENSILYIFPNPFTTQATVKYSIPTNSKNATLIIYDVLGRVRNTYKLEQREGQVNINASNLSSGIYFYSLVADGKTVITKKMVVE